MPQRFLKPGLPASAKWDGCSWPAQSFYVRLITLVDDFGRYEAAPLLLRSHAFPLREDIRAAQVLEFCRELAAQQLAYFYKADGKEYLQLTNWTEKPRAEKSKYTAYDESTCEQLFADVCKCWPSSSSSPSSSPPSKEVIGSSPSDPNLLSPRPEKPKKPDLPIPGSRIDAIHAWYCKAMGSTMRLDAANERAWYEFLLRFSEAEFQSVFTYLQKQIKLEKRNVGALKLSNLLQPDRFAEDLALVQMVRRPRPNAPAAPLPQTEFKPASEETLKALRESVK